MATTLQSDTNYYSFDGCSIQVNFGTYARRIYIWKATEWFNDDFLIDFDKIIFCHQIQQLHQLYNKKQLINAH